MAKEVAGQIKLQIKGGAANPSPPVGPAWVLRVLILWSFASNLMPEPKTRPVRYYLL